MKFKNIKKQAKTDTPYVYYTFLVTFHEKKAKTGNKFLSKTFLQHSLRTYTYDSVSDELIDAKEVLPFGFLPLNKDEKKYLRLHLKGNLPFTPKDGDCYRILVPYKGINGKVENDISICWLDCSQVADFELLAKK